MIIQLGNMYIRSMSLDSYDTDFDVSFTSELSEAKEFDIINEKYMTDILRALFDIEFNIVYTTEGSDKE